MRFTSNLDTYYKIFHDWGKRNTFEDEHKEELAIQKLGQLEDIEEELGIDLITLFKALKNGIWIKKTIIEKREIKNVLLFYEDVNLYKDYLYACPVDIYNERVCIYQYGKTWALTREELE